MPDNAAVFLLYARQETGGINECQQWRIESIAEAHKRGHLVRRVNIQDSGQHAGLVRDDAHRTSLDTTETNNNIRSEAWLDLEKVLIIQHSRDHRAHVVCDFRICRHHVVQLGIGLQRLFVRQPRSFFQVVGGQKAQKAPTQRQCSEVIFGNKVNNARAIHLRRGPAHSSAVTISPVTCLMTCGPVMNICARLV